MLSKKYRLNRKQIGYLHRKGRRYSIPEMGIKYLSNRLEYSRFGVNIPSKVYKQAVDRNRLRRKIYEALGQYQFSGYDVIISCYRKIDEESIKTKTDQLLYRLGR